MEEYKNTRGGRREGAGRKPKDNKTQTVAFSISPELFAKMVFVAETRGISRSRLIVDALEAYLQ